MMETKPIKRALSLCQARPKRGQTLVEYSLVLALISVAAIAVLNNMGTQVKGTFSTINSQMADAQRAGAAPVTPPRGG